MAGLSPTALFTLWMEDAVQAGVAEPRVMSLATVGRNNRPKVRVVTLGNFDDKGFVFETSSGSQKAADLEQNPFAAISFYWGKLRRTVRIEGEAEKLPKDYETAFEMLPKSHRIAIYTSEKQSHPTGDWENVKESYERLKEKFSHTEKIPKPAFLRSYRVVPDSIQFMQDHADDLADRFLFRKDDEGHWTFERLYP